ncbi:MAG: TPM domain-containing protein [Spirochaetes bacterium]|nr:TPM domain-containing protein [Spirochaetota bacterium]
MKTVIAAVSFIILASPALMPPSASAQVFPEIKHPVNDYANVINPAQEARIAKMLVDHRKKTGVQMAVLTVRTTQPVGIEEFSIKTAEKWGGGSEERDDGLLFTVAVYDRRMRIEVGRGLEGYITDLRAGRILAGIREDFREYRYGQGIEKAVDEMISDTAELRPGQDVPASARMRGVFFHIVNFYVVFFFIGILLAVLHVRVMERLKAPVWMNVVGGISLLIAMSVLLQLFLHGAWFWTPMVFATGALVGPWMAGIPRALRKGILSRTAIVFSALPALASFVAVVWCLHVLKPSHDDTTIHETVLLVILFFTNMAQFLAIFGIYEGFQGGGASYGGGYSSSGQSGGASSSSDANSTSWSGGGGSFGGGGSSSSW